MQVMRPRVVALQIGEEWHGLPAMTAEQKEESVELLRVFAASERARAAAAMAKNTLEAYIINTRSAINNDEDVAAVRCSPSLHACHTAPLRLSACRCGGSTARQSLFGSAGCCFATFSADAWPGRWVRRHAWMVIEVGHE